MRVQRTQAIPSPTMLSVLWRSETKRSEATELRLRVSREGDT